MVGGLPLARLRSLTTEYEKILHQLPVGVRRRSPKRDFLTTGGTMFFDLGFIRYPNLDKHGRTILEAFCFRYLSKLSFSITARALQI